MDKQIGIYKSQKVNKQIGTEGVIHSKIFASLSYSIQEEMSSLLNKICRTLIPTSCQNLFFLFVQKH